MNGNKLLLLLLLLLLFRIHIIFISFKHWLINTGFFKDRHYITRKAVPVFNNHTMKIRSGWGAVEEAPLILALGTRCRCGQLHAFVAFQKAHPVYKRVTQSYE